MRDEAKEDQPRQRDMPFISPPSETAHSHRRVGIARQIDITSAAPAPSATDFVMGVDTCGYTSMSTITCDFGYQCTNVGVYRGCCVAGGADCVSTIYTTCVDYGVVPDAALCGPHTLCCPATALRCFSYAFTTSTEPGATFTHVQCQETHGFGEMYPLPPELIPTTTADDAAASNASSTDAVEPAPTNAPKVSSVGAIAGAVCGVIALIILAAVAAFLVIRRRRQRTAAAADAAANGGQMEETQLGDTSSGPGTMAPAAAVTAAGAGRLRPLSTIHEQSSPVSPAREKHLSASARQSYGPNWPLSRKGKPPAANPVDLEKRLSLSGQGGSSEQLPQQQPPQPLPKSPRASASGGGSPKSAAGAGAGLRSPRLSTYVPVSPIDASFTENIAGPSSSSRANRLSINPNHPGITGGLNSIITNNIASSSSADRAAPQTHAASLETLTSVGADRNASTHVLSERDSEPVIPVSPISDEDGDDDDDVDHRMSFVSAASVAPPGDHHKEGRASDLVSPLTPDDPSNPGRRASPHTVSPLETRRSSLA
ncbi:Uu.00g042750.m01.CDS01 [Anthostomella pinea]|uniref:Uu.00g042750.m01.CDS01 n=1 Tax=Anthostomella pinea TaxID=933095 RepID=A0AAI8YE61_9PEZI|nr:Uu.00g042750.m01.CDS01 [Anthostomella pinea]